MIILNEVPARILRSTSKLNLRCFYTILNAFRATIYAVYYLRKFNTTGDSLLHRFTHRLKTAQGICQERNSEGMSNIALPQSSFFCFESYDNIKRTVIKETKSLRCQDNQFRTKHRIPKTPYTFLVYSISSNCKL